MKNSEHQEQVLLFDILRLNEKKYPFLKWIFAIPNGGHRLKSVANYLKREGVRAGIHDVHCPIPKHGWHGLWIELKVNKNGLTEKQKEFQEFLIEQGYRTEVCYSAQEAIRTIENYLEIRLSK